MVGQIKLQQIIDKYIATTFPRTLLLEGPRGCGKHMLCKIIAEKMSLEVSDITETLSLETIEDIMLSTSPKIYIIDTTHISIREQNIILKFLEEPLKNAYILVLCESKSNLIQTVINRCLVLSFDAYTVEELKTFLKEGVSEDLLQFCNTPGIVLELQDSPFQSMISLATQIFQKLRQASYSNVLSIPNKVYYKEPKKDLLDFDLFIYILLNISYQEYVKGTITFNEYDYTDKFYNACRIKNINKQQLFEHYVIALKRFYEGEPLDEI